MAKLPETFTAAAEVTDNLSMILRVMANYPNSWDSAARRVEHVAVAIAFGQTDLGALHAAAVEANGFAFMGSGAGMRRLDSLWTKFLERFPATVEDAEVAAHITNDLINAG